jgi:hypothetical protein
MKKLFIASLLGVALAFQAQAGPITGGMGITGTAILDTGNVGTANAVTTWGPVVVNVASGDFAAGGIGFFNPVSMLAPVWVFDPTTPYVPFLRVTGINAPNAIYTFNLTSSAINSQNASSLDIDGMGIMTSSVAGQDPTPFIWNLTTQNPPIGNNPPIFTFSASTFTPDVRVPDGGMTIGLLGLALLGIQALRRNIS